jgi:hypothetical protein
VQSAESRVQKFPMTARHDGRSQIDQLLTTGGAQGLTLPPIQGLHFPPPVWLAGWLDGIYEAQRLKLHLLASGSQLQ